MDSLDMAKKAYPYGVFLVDLEPAKTFIEKYRRERKTALTYDFLILRACALALPDHPEVTRMLRGKKLVQCGSIDIGISVAGKGNIAPVAVIEEADRKSLPDLREVYKEKVRQARREEEEFFKRLNLLARCIPGGFIRKIFVRFIVKSQRLKRKYVGNFQISGLSTPLGEYGAANMLSTAFLLGIGGISKRAIAVNDKPEVRLTVYLIGQIDHRILDAKKAFEFCRELKDRLEHPETLV